MNQLTQAINEVRKALMQIPECQIALSTSQFFTAFLTELEKLRVDEYRNIPNIDEVIEDRIKKYHKELLNAYIDFIETLCLSQKQIDPEKFITFFEEVNKFSRDDLYKFIIRELFLYTIAVLLKNQQFKAIEVLTNTHYFIDLESGDQLESNFSIFDRYVETLERLMNKRLYQGRSKSVAARIVLDNATNRYPQDFLVETDLLLYYLDCLNNQNPIRRWYPRLHHCVEYYNLWFFKRLKSKRYLEKAMVIFSANNIDELKDKLRNINYKLESVRSIPKIESLISLDDLGSIY